MLCVLWLNKDLKTATFPFSCLIGLLLTEVIIIYLIGVFFHLSKWTPTGRRLITGSQSGEFTLWNGQSFNFEMILQVHKNIILFSYMFISLNRSQTDGF